jgi:hypothetical protein
MKYCESTNFLCAFYTKQTDKVLTLTAGTLPLKTLPGINPNPYRTIIKRFDVYRNQAIPLQAWTGTEGSRTLRLPDFKTIGT